MLQVAYDHVALSTATHPHRKSSKAVAALVLDASVSHFAAKLSGWAAGTRIGNDSVWIKPPSAGTEVAYHRDSWYVPYPCVTAWVTLTDVDASNGTLEYVPGSHAWPPAPPFNRDEFHVATGQFRAPAQRLADAAGKSPSFVKVVAPAGSIAFHHGDLLHGSDVNRNPVAWRKSLGIHLIAADTLHGDRDGYIYGRYKRFGERAMSEEAFPVTWTPRGYASPIIPRILAGEPW